MSTAHLTNFSWLSATGGIRHPFWRPAEFNAPVEGGARYTCAAGSFLIGQHLLPDFQEHIRPLIGVLYERSCPAHVAGEIPAVIINAVKRVLSGRLRTHIGKERLERIDPGSVHPNAAAAVPWKSLVMLVGAAPNHATPAIIFRRVSQSMLAALTEARFCLAGRKSVEAAYRRSATITYVFDFPFPGGREDLAHYGQASLPDTGGYTDFWHARAPLRLGLLGPHSLDTLAGLPYSI